MQLSYLLLGIGAFAAMSNANLSLDIEPKGDFVSVLAGQKDFELTCSVSNAPHNTNITWDVMEDRGNGNIMHMPQASDSSVISRVVKIKEVQANIPEQQFSCRVETPGQTLEQPVTLVLSQEYSFSKDDLTSDKLLSCSKNLSSFSDVIWKKMVNNDKDDENVVEKPVSDLPDSNKYKTMSDNSLRISKPDRKSAGFYYAEYKDSNGATRICGVSYQASPLVLAFEKSRNLIEEENLELKCSVISYPKSDVKWFKDGSEIKAGNRITLSKHEGHKSGALTIKNINFDDAGMYNCTACGHDGECSSQEVTVRVKDKLAALWPFLGIVAEVVVLCAIIFFYERRRNKQADQAELDAQDNADNAADNVEGLRHRNTTNNPRA